MSRPINHIAHSNEKRWSHADVERLHALAPGKTVKELADLLKRPVSSIAEMLRLFELKAKANNGCGRGRFWTDEEVQFLKDNWFSKSTAQLARELGRSESMVGKKANQVGLKKGAADRIGMDYWTDEQIQYVKANYGRVSAQEMSRVLGKSKAAIHTKASQDLGLRDPNWGAYEWTAEEDQYLLDNYPAKKQKEIAQQLGRSVAQVTRRLKLQIGSDKNLSADAYKKGKWTPEEDQYLLDQWPTRSTAFIAIALNRKRYRVKERAKALGLRRTTEQRQLLAKAEEALTDASVLYKLDHRPDIHATYLNQYPKFIQIKRLQLILISKINQHERPI